MMSNNLTNSSFIYGEELITINAFNTILEKNELIDSKLFLLKSEKQNFVIFIVLNNYLKGDSYLITLEQNSVVAGSFFKMEESNFQNNIIEKSLILGEFKSSESLNFNQIIISNNILKENIFDLKAYSDGKEIEINFDNLVISSTNAPLIQNQTSEISINKQSFIIIEGNFKIRIENSSLIDNFCYVGPCGFHFYPSETNSVANIISTIFSNNLVLYSDENDVPSCLLFLEGSLQLIIQNVIMVNNSVNYLNENNQIENGEKGNPCFYSDFSETSLLITNSIFSHNSGYGNYGESYCILFKGNSLEISNSLFLENFGPIDNQIFLFVLDCSVITMTNTSIIGSIGGTILIDTQREFIQIISKNLSIANNEASVYSLYFMLQSYDFTFEEMYFNNNFCYYSALLATVNSLGEDPEDQKLMFINSFFNNNTSIETAVWSVIIEFYTIGSFTNFTNCSFENNYATGEDDYGGIAYACSEVNGYVTFLDCNLKNNSATFGGICYSLLGTFIFQNSFIKNNEARSSNG